MRRVMFRLTVALCLLEMIGTGAVADPGSGAEDASGVHFRFDSPDDWTLLKEGHVGSARAAGDLLIPATPAGSPSPVSQRELGNERAAAFDGSRSIFVTTTPGNAAGLVDGFTWEGFFFLPSANKCKTDGAIADRFISQFVDETGGSTRLTVGLSILKEGNPANLCIAFAGESTRRAGRTAVIPDIWHHFAVVHQPGNEGGTLTWYLDYEAEGTLVLDGKSPRTTLKPPGTAPFTIGARLRQNEKVDRGFNGSLDEIRLSSRPLSPDEFLRLKQTSYERNVVVRVYEELPDSIEWDWSGATPIETLEHEALALTALPPRFSDRGYLTQRTGRQGISASAEVTLPAGSFELLLRTTSDAVLSVDGRILIDGRLTTVEHPLGTLPRTARDGLASFESDGQPHRFELSARFDAGPNSELGDVVVCYSPKGNGSWKLLGAVPELPLDPVGWAMYRSRAARYFRSIEPQRRQAALARGDERWRQRHQRAREIAAQWKIEPPAGEGNPIDRFLAGRQQKANISPAPLVDDAEFFRRLSLDVCGRIPTLDELQAFLADERADKRDRAVDAMLASPEWADGWVGYWQDVLAENPSILKPTLNNSGPFRRWIHESFRRNLPMDRFATELVLMEGGDDQGGTAGFAIATENDSPMAMKAHVVVMAFLAVDMKCARCHDSPESFLEQRDLFSLAALLNEQPLTLPKTSTVAVPAGARQPLVTTSLKVGEKIEPQWTLEEIVSPTAFEAVAAGAVRPRERLAGIVTSPLTSRFSDVLVNRVWKRYMGTGLVEPVDQWLDSADVDHPQLLRFLSGTLVESGYDLKAVAGLIFTSQAYQRSVGEREGEAASAFAAQTRRRCSAEQIVDSMHIASGKPFDAEELTFDPNETRGFLNLGIPQRAWQLTSMSNERDRPALSMPVNQSIVDVLKVFGWREERPDPITVREESPNPLQPLMLANGLMAWRVVRLTEESRITETCLQELTIEELVDRLFLRVLSRLPDAGERSAFVELLAPGFETRRTGKPKPPVARQKRAAVDWDKHLEAEASLELLAAERLVREGEPATIRLTPEFRERVEDAVWCLMNTPEFLFVP